MSSTKTKLAVLEVRTQSHSHELRQLRQFKREVLLDKATSTNNELQREKDLKSLIDTYIVMIDINDTQAKRMDVMSERLDIATQRINNLEIRLNNLKSKYKADHQRVPF